VSSPVCGKKEILLSKTIGTGTITVSGIVATFEAGNSLRAISSAISTGAGSGSAYAAGSVIGAALGNDQNTITVNVAREITVNLNGSQVVGALAEAEDNSGAQPANIKVNTFGAVNTDKVAGGIYGWRVGIFAAGAAIGTEAVVESPSTVNILGAKLGSAVAFPVGGDPNAGKAVLTLGADQGKLYVASDIIPTGYSAGQNS
jgi:hypothetical protein